MARKGLTFLDFITDRLCLIDTRNDIHLNGIKIGKKPYENKRKTQDNVRFSVISHVKMEK